MLYLNKTFRVRNKDVVCNLTQSNLKRLFSCLNEDVLRHMNETPPVAATPEIIKRFNNSDYNITGTAPCLVDLANIQLLYEMKMSRADGRNVVSLGNRSGAIEIYNNTLEPFIFNFHSLYHINKHLVPKKRPILLRDYARVETKPETLSWKEVRYV